MRSREDYEYLPRSDVRAMYELYHRDVLHLLQPVSDGVCGVFNLYNLHVRLPNDFVLRGYILLLREHVRQTVHSATVLPVLSLRNSVE